MKRSFALFALLLLAPAGFTQDAKPKLEKDIVYGKAGGVDLQLDLAMPAGQGPFPAVVCIHGGGWRFGNRKDLTKVIEELAAKGYVAVTFSYRLSDQAPFPAQIEDCKTAVRWLRANAAKYQVDPNRIGCVGMSSRLPIIGIADDSGWRYAVTLDRDHGSDNPPSASARAMTRSTAPSRSAFQSEYAGSSRCIGRSLTSFQIGPSRRRIAR